jgi:cell division protein FtsA
MIMPDQAESLKVRFGKAIAEQAAENEAVSIPGIRHRSPKEISVRNLAEIIEARMKEIITEVHNEILRSNYNDKLSIGIVLTGGGSLLNGIRDLFGYMTSLDVRRGLPTEHLSHHKIELIKNPIFATSVGLVIAGFRALDDRESLFKNSNVTNGSGSTNSIQGSETLKEVAPLKKESNFFQKILEKTKSLLIDDIDDKKDY